MLDSSIMSVLMCISLLYYVESSDQEDVKESYVNVVEVYCNIP